VVTTLVAVVVAPPEPTGPTYGEEFIQAMSILDVIRMKRKETRMFAWGNNTWGQVRRTALRLHCSDT
jgi:hypothetical protein